MRDELVGLLKRLLVTHAPSGVEGEMDEIVLERLRECSDDVRRDPHGNIYITFPGKEGGPLTLVTGHKDELGLLVHKIDEDGKIWIEPLGGCLPAKYGEGPFDLITEKGVIEGVLCMGATHISAKSSRIHQAKTGHVTWDLVYLDCKLDRKQLEERGAMLGDRAVIGRRRKPPVFLHDEYVGGYALDDKAAVAILLLLAQRLKEKQPVHDLCLAATSNEEGGVSGASYLCRQLDPHDVIAVEVGPVAEEYTAKMNEQPVVLFKDAYYYYNTELTRELIAAGKRCGVECQASVARSFGSDASGTIKAGLNGRGACLCFPTENTHGYEIAPLAAMENCVAVLMEHLT